MSTNLKQRFDDLDAWQRRGPIYRYRQKQKLTITEFAELVGCTFSNVSYWETQGGMPKRHLQSVAKLLAVHPTTLQKSIKTWKAKRPA